MREPFGEEDARYVSDGQHRDGEATRAMETATRQTTGESRTTNVLMRAGTSRTRPSAVAPAGPSATSPAAPVGTEDTAEIPVVRATGTRSRPPVELEDGTLWYPGVSRRLPAPFALRLAVWLLFFLLVVGLAGLAVERYHPDWLSIVRNTGPAAAATSPVGGGGPAAQTTSTGAPAVGGLRLERTTSSASTYAVGASSFTIKLTFDHACWTRIAEPAGSSHYLVEGTLQASDSPKVVKVTTSASVYLGASTKSITIASSGHTLGVVQTPRVGHSYEFVPAGR